MIAAILGLIAIASTAAIAGVALHQTIQTTTFVQQWHKNACEAWNSQIKIDLGINERLVDPQNAVLIVGDEVHNLKKLVRLRCDCNVTEFCITPHLYHNSEHAWSTIRRHLKSHLKDNLTLDIDLLQAKEKHIQDAKLSLLSESELFDGIHTGLSKMFPTDWIKNIGSGLIGNVISECIVSFHYFLLSLQMHERKLPRTD